MFSLLVLCFSAMANITLKFISNIHVGFTAWFLFWNLSWFQLYYFRFNFAFVVPGICWDSKNVKILLTKARSVAKHQSISKECLSKSNMKLNCRTRTQPKDHILSHTYFFPLNCFSVLQWNEKGSCTLSFQCESCKMERKNVNGLIISWHGFYCFRRTNNMEHITNETNKL